MCLMLLHWPQVWSSCCDSDGLPEKRGQQRTVLSTDALPFALNDEGLQQFRAKRCALEPVSSPCQWGGGAAR